MNKSDIFHKFSDGLEFKPDIGRIKKLGEVFTPYPIVVKMIKDIGISKDKSYATVLEPASGHGNFGVEILKFKIKKVLKEIKEDNIPDQEFTKEYEIRSLLALASLYSNDIDKQNIQELKQRYSRYMSMLYLKYSKNKDNQIPTYYDIAISNILDTNTILSDFIGKNSNKIKTCFYFREDKKSEFIFRIVMTLEQIKNYKKATLFDTSIGFVAYDKINYKDWVLGINKSYIVSQNQSITSKRNKNMENNDAKIYDQIAKKILTKFNKPEDFKFKYCISNPPYQLTVNKNSGINDNQAIPLYHHFFMSSLSLNSSIICPAKWKSGGLGLDKFREFIYSNHDIYSLVTFNDSNELFPTANVGGGISIINWTKDWNKPAKLWIYKKLEEKPEFVERYIDSIKLDTPIIIDDPYGASVIEKIQKKSIYFFDKIIQNQPYGFRGDIFNKYEEYKDEWTTKNDPYAYKIFGIYGKKGGAKRKTGWVKKSSIKKDPQNSKDKYKLFFSKTFTFNPPFITIPKIIIGMPKEICSETFFAIGPFNTYSEAKNCLSYIETKFWRYLFKLYWSGMHVSYKSFSLIPLVDFNKPWTDKELYEYFNLSEEEVNYIEKIIGEFNNADD